MCNLWTYKSLFYSTFSTSAVLPIVMAITPLDLPVTLREHNNIMPVVIQLNVSGNPQPLFSWRQVGSQMPLSNGSGVTVTFDSLTFNNIGRERTGQYVYEAVNSVGRSNISFEVDVQCKLVLQNACSLFDTMYVTLLQFTHRSQSACTCIQILRSFPPKCTCLIP